MHCYPGWTAFAAARRRATLKHNASTTVVSEPLETVAKSKLVKYTVSKKSPTTKTFWKVTTVTPEQRRWFNLVGIKNPMNLADFCGGES